MDDLIDITEDFVAANRRVVDAQEKQETQLREFLGEVEASTQMTRMEERLAAREADVHIRELYVATPTT